MPPLMMSAPTPLVMESLPVPPSTSSLPVPVVIISLPAFASLKSEGKKYKKLQKEWIYKGYYKMPDGAINMELKRMEGHIELKVDSIDNYKDYIHTAVEGFIKEVYKHSVHEAKSISIEKHDTEIDIYEKEIMKLQLELENAKKVTDKFKEISKSL